MPKKYLKKKKIYHQEDVKWFQGNQALMNPTEYLNLKINGDSLPLLIKISFIHK